jgi:uncharacterized membrane protein
MSFKRIKLLPLSILLVACSSHTYDDVEADAQPLPELVTFQEVQFIFNNACLQCHSNPPQNGAPMSLESFENVRDAVLTRDLINRISRPEGESGLMPLGGPRLPQNNIDLIVQWQVDGLLQN